MFSILIRKTINQYAEVFNLFSPDIIVTSKVMVFNANFNNISVIS
jgi:hypothetical protein